ncbi:hypothetical protein JCM8547_002633 [Rhodosporidiobolus lusitaniae]
MDTLPLYLNSHPSSPIANDHEDASRLSFPASVHTLALESHDGHDKRRSFRPPLPPKPILATRTSSGMNRSRSADSPVLHSSPSPGFPIVTIGGGTGGGGGYGTPMRRAGAGGSPRFSDGSASQASQTSPTTWMNAMLGGANASSGPELRGGEYGDEDDDPMRYTTLRLTDGVGLGLPSPSGALTPGSAARSAAATPILNQGPTLAFPTRSKEPPAVPPRPGAVATTKLSTPPLQAAPYFDPSTLVDAPPSPSSAPPAISPFLSASSSGLTSVPPTTSSFTSHAPPPFRSHYPTPPPHLASSAASISSFGSASTAHASSSSAPGVFSAANKLRSHLGAGVGFAREWGGKGKNKVQEGWRGFGTGGGHRTAASTSTAASSVGSWTSEGPPAGGAFLPPSASSPQLDSSAARLPHSPSLPIRASSSSFQPSTSSSTTPTGALAIRLPTTILGVKVPSQRGLAFGVPLAPLVTLTRVPAPPVHTPYSSDEITGTLAREYLPGIAFRCMEYLSLWGEKEEGIYRIPGRSHMVNQLRVMFDAGVGQELDLREIHPGDLDPAAVASVFKSWLRELPETLLSPTLEALIDALTLQHLGYSASSSSFLSCTTSASTPSSLPGATGVSGAAPEKPVGLVDGRAPREYVETLREVMAVRMEPENWHLLRAIAYHLARLSAHSATNKMTMANLRLILSPTLRLTPGFVQVLVAEREILFSKANEAARQRQVRSSSLSTPPMPQQSSFSNTPTGRNSPRLQPTPGSSSPLLNPPSPSFGNFTRPTSPPASQPTLPHSTSNTSAGSWLIVDAVPRSPPISDSFAAALPLDAGRLSPVPHSAPCPSANPVVIRASPESIHPTTSSSSFPSPALATHALPPPPQRHSPSTPIADRFASTSSSSLPSSAPTRAPSNLSLHNAYTAGVSSLPPPIATKPAFLPSRDKANGAGGGGFFSAREVPSASGVSGRKGSVSSGGGVGGTGSRKGSFASQGEEKEKAEKQEKSPPTALRETAMSLSKAFDEGLSLTGGTSGSAIVAEPEEEEEQERLADPAAPSSAFSSSSGHDGGKTDSPSRPRSRLRARLTRRSSSTSSSASMSSSTSSSFSASLRHHHHQQQQPSPVKVRPSTMELTTLPMPSGLSLGGIGLGLGGGGEGGDGVRRTGEAGGEEEGEGWGLLSFEERKKFFGG